MSDQSDALNKLARERGIISDSPAETPFVLAPRDGESLLHFASNAAEIVGKNGLFRRETTPVTIDPESGRVEDMQPDRLRTYLESQLVPYVRRRGKYDSDNVKLPVTISVSEARGCLASDAFRYPLRKLKRVNFVRLPVMRADGRIELLPKGYDQESGVLTMKDCLDYPDNWDLEHAVLFLNDFFGEFPWENQRSYAVHVCAMQAVYGADLLPPGAKRLNIAYRANASRAGKGLLLQTAIVGPCGPFVQIQAIPDSKDEFRKILDTEALNASRYIVFDEVENRLRDRTLNAFLTATIWTGRLMNSQKKFAVPQSSIVFIAGNNIDLSSDLTGRFLLVDLYVAEADVQSRKIKHVFDEVYLSRPEVRADLLAASWALLRVWDKAGRLRPSSVYRGFDMFSNIFGGIVEHAGFANPLESTAREADSNWDDMIALVEELSREIIGGKVEYQFDQVIEAARRINAFEWRLHHGPAQGETGKSGLTPTNKSWFGKLLGDRYGGTRFTLADGRHVRFGKRGRNRQRLYEIEIVGGGRTR